MARAIRILAFAAVFLGGLLLGVYVQHRWPLGTARERLAAGLPPAPVSLAAIRSIPRDRVLVLLVAGQSNAANYGGTRRAAGAGVYAFADGVLRPAVDPLPGADGFRGSVWTRLGARLMATRRWDAVILAPVAKGSTSIADWTPAGPLGRRLVGTVRQLVDADLAPDFLLWHQGETDGSNPSASGAAYSAGFDALVSACRGAEPGLKVLIAVAARHRGDPVNEQIRLAQQACAQLPDVYPGPDFDAYGPELRSDGVHLNAAGLDAAAEAWKDVILKAQ